MQNQTSRSLVASVIAVLIVAGYPILGARPAFQRGAEPANTLPRPRVPIGYDPAPDNLGIQIRAPKIDGPGFTAPVTNRGVKSIVGLTYVAIVARVPHIVPVTVLTSPEWTIALAPGQTTEIRDTWLNAETLDRLIKAEPGDAQIFLAPNRIRYADGSEWQRPKIDTTATDHVVALGFRTPDVPRSLIATEAGPSAAANLLCRDDQGAGFSAGAVLAVRNEPGKQARCQGGRWVEVKP